MMVITPMSLQTINIAFGIGDVIASVSHRNVGAVQHDLAFASKFRSVSISFVFEA